MTKVQRLAELIAGHGCAVAVIDGICIWYVGYSSPLGDGWLMCSARSVREARLALGY